MLVAISATESTPPLYYLAGRVWALLFGTGEVGLRALSALAGTLTIPVVYAAAAALGSRKAGLFAAALTAASPALVWYSQEARSYALLVLLCGLSLLFLARALRDGSGRAVAWWSLTAMLALLTHYFAGFLVAAQALWLLAAYPSRRVAVLAVAPVGACCAALLQLAVRQSGQGNLDFIESTPIATRAADVGELFLAGPTGGRLDYGVPLLAALVLLALAPAIGSAPVRGAVLLPASLVLAGISVPLLLALAGLDYVLARNFLPFWPAAAIVVAMGLSAERSGRLGAAAAAALVGVSLWLVAAVALHRTLQRDAVTAALVPGGLDAEEQRVAARVGYAVAGEGEHVRAKAACPEGYAQTSGGAAWLSSGADEPLPGASTRSSRRGWTASARSLGGDERILSVYAICVRPVD